MFFHLASALMTSRFHGGKFRLNTGFGILNGKLDGLMNVPEEISDGQLIDPLYNMVSTREVDWSTCFEFCSLNSNEQASISIDIMHPDRCYLFFIPIVFQRMEEGGLYFSLDVTKTELIAQGDGVKLKSDSSNKVFKEISNNVKTNVAPEKTTKDNGKTKEIFIALLFLGFLLLLIYVSNT